MGYERVYGVRIPTHAQRLANTSPTDIGCEMSVWFFLERHVGVALYINDYEF